MLRTRPQRSPASTAPGIPPGVCLAALAAALITFMAFLPAMTAGFLNWDDDLNFLTNPHYRGLGPQQLAWMFTTFHMGPYQPLAWVTLGLDYTLWTMEPAGYHFTSVLIHSINAGLCVVAAFLILTAAAGLKRPAGAGGIDTAPSPRNDAENRGGLAILGASLFAGLLFAIHPLRVESVAWITERRDVVSGLFFLLMLVAYLKAAAIERTGGRPTGHRIAAFCFFVLSLLGKATGVTAPIALLILDVVPLRRLPASPRRWFEDHRSVLLEKVPWLAVSMIIGVVAVIGQKQVGALKGVVAAGLVERGGLAMFGSMFYVWKTVFPWNLSPLYELRDTFSLASPGVILAGVALVTTTAIVVLSARRRPALPAAWFAYLLLVAPVSGFARAGNQIAADRYTYLACLPWAFLAGAAWLAVSRDRRMTAFAGGGLILMMLGGLTFAQTRVWRDSVVLWTHATRLDPGGERAAMNMAAALVDAGRLNEAELIYRRRIAAENSDLDARYSLGMVLLRTGRATESERTFRELIRDRPDFPMGHYGLGIIEMQRGNRIKARASLEEALRILPGLALARQAMAEITP